MRRFWLLFAGLFFPGLLFFGCTNNDGGVTEVGGNVTQALLKPFLDAGCEYEQTSLDCANASFASDFQCVSSWLRIRNESVALDPALLLLECDTFAYGNNLTESQMDEYFYCRGGLAYSCVSYIMWDGSEFVQIKNGSELSGRIQHISGGKEALNYVLLSEYVQPEVERGILGPLRAKAVRNGDKFIVTAYHHNPFGCYSKIDYEEVTYEVSADGSIKETGRKVAYTKELGYMICAD